MLLTAHIRKVRFPARPAFRVALTQQTVRPGNIVGDWFNHALAAEVTRQVSKRLYREHLDSLYERSLSGIAGRHEHGLEAFFPRHRNHRQHAVRVPQRAVKRQFAQKHGGGWSRGQLP